MKRFTIRENGRSPSCSSRPCFSRSGQPPAALATRRQLAAPPPGPTPAEVQKNLDFVWTLVAAFLVFFMQAGFAMVESGFTRAKNAVNIMMKNLMDFSVGSIAFSPSGSGSCSGQALPAGSGRTGFSSPTLPRTPTSGFTPSGCSRSSSPPPRRPSSRGRWRRGRSSPRTSSTAP